MVWKKQKGEQYEGDQEYPCLEIVFWSVQIIKKLIFEDFPGGPVVKTLPFRAKEFDPWVGR